MIREILGSIPFAIKSSLRNVKLYGWLPYAKPPEKSARDNLIQVLFALGAVIKTDLDGVLQIQPLWDGVSRSIEWDKIYQGARAQRDSAVSSISVTEHNYILGGESETLFEGDAISGDIITFSEPVYNLTATGFSILERGANYAKLSAGSGILTGTKYIHNTREITRTVTPGVPEHVVSIEDATLVSFVNSNSVADMLANYYQRSEIINCDIVLDRQSPGDVLNVYHPYTKEAAPACLESLDISVSGIMKASIKAVVGYIPLKNTSVEYFDSRQVFASNTTFTVPAGVHNIRAILIGGGQGGQGGYNGGAGGTGGTASFIGTSGSATGTGGTVGAGGSGGTGGSGGRVAIVDIPVEPGQTMTISIDTGGAGGSSGGRAGSAGGNTTVTVDGQSYSSSSGSSAASGYTDPTTGQTYARSGGSGTAEGKGGTSGTAYFGMSGAGESVGGYSGGAGNNAHEYQGEGVFGNYPNGSTFVERYILAGGGGGAAPGGSGNKGSTKGGNGGSAGGVSSPSASDYGRGGNGGNGGGGGGAGGVGWVNATVTSGSGYPASMSQAGAAGGSGGSGSAGSRGANGCAVLYYSEAKESPAGSPLDKNKKLILDRFGRTIVF